MAQLTFVVTVDIDQYNQPSKEIIQEVLTKMEDIANQYGLDLYDSEVVHEIY